MAKRKPSKADERWRWMMENLEQVAWWLDLDIDAETLTATIDAKLAEEAAQKEKHGTP